MTGQSIRFARWNVPCNAAGAIKSRIQLTGTMISLMPSLAVEVAHNFVLFDSSWSWVNGVPIGGVETDEQRRARQKEESESWYAARLRGYLAMHGGFGWPPFA
jgi:hypothetical protein